MTAQIQTCPYPWCQTEDTVPARVSGSGTVHYGACTTVIASDDRVTIRVLALPDPDLDQNEHVEMATTERVGVGAYREASTWLTASEIDELVTALTTARASLVEATSTPS